ncbi:hypothetical protein ACFL5Q_02430 [Planctomycetota bacterium]
MKPSNDVSSWLILLVVLATAFVTSWAMMKFRPSQGPDASYFYPPQQVAQHLSPGLASLQGGWQFAAATTGSPTIQAATTGPPTIRAGAVPLHADRGICTQCHIVVGAGQRAVPPISSSSTMPHEYRGVCSNCHVFLNTSRFNSYRTQTATAMPVAAPMPPVATPRAAAQTPAWVATPPAVAQAPATAATEGAWMGMEVTPITSLTANQYGIPAGTRGLLVAEAEAQAATAGVKAGDVVVWINGAQVNQMADFFQVTKNGTLTPGVVGIVRKGKRMTVDLAQTATPAAAPTPNTNPNAAPAAMRAGLPMPQGNYFSTAPAAMPMPQGNYFSTAPAAMQAAMPMPQSNFSTAPANMPAPGRPAGQGSGVASRTNPAPCLQRQF